MITLAIFILSFISGAAKGFADTLYFHYSSSVFKQDSKFWNPLISWQNKYISINPLVRKKFWGISVPVFLTDGWHLCNSVFIEAIFLCIVFYRPFTPYILMDLFLLRLSFGVGFSFFYNFFLIKQK